MSPAAAKNPLGGADCRRVTEAHPLESVSVESVVQRDNMLKAWKQVKANKGAPGVDDITTEEFPKYAKEHWEGIKTVLLEGTYKPSPVKRVEIPKDSRTDCVVLRDAVGVYPCSTGTPNSGCMFKGG
jgi:RNA-directed DNA polymerase